jgi:hypothetical protein
VLDVLLALPLLALPLDDPPPLLPLPAAPSPLSTDPSGPLCLCTVPPHREKTRSVHPRAAQLPRQCRMTQISLGKGWIAKGQMSTPSSRELIAPTRSRAESNLVLCGRPVLSVLAPLHWTRVAARTRAPRVAGHVLFRPASGRPHPSFSSTRHASVAYAPSSQRV